MYRFSLSGVITRIDPQQAADALAMAVVVSLPWSTSATGILIVLWILSMLRFLSFSRLERSLYDLRKLASTLAGGVPILLWLLAVCQKFILFLNCPYEPATLSAC